ncbi:MAG: SDR family oxidoreductase, partial [Aestuariivirga sp.]|uniref:SDR family oxidoreductase n=1 Tax=Aestuariivirga sp. TaxID=2650926 RepID=UPI00301A3552
MFSLAGRKILVVGIANEHSIAWGCAKAFKAQGADLAVTYLNDKAAPSSPKSRPFSRAGVS